MKTLIIAIAFQALPLCGEAIPTMQKEYYGIRWNEYWGTTHTVVKEQARAYYKFVERN